MTKISDDKNEKNKDLVSVIVPVYDVKPYLVECLDSILNQTYQNLEVLLVDDGSLDGSEKICDDYAEKDNRFKAFHKVNGGLSDARNYGIERARGKYIYFCDSDDYIEMNCIEKLVMLIKEERADSIIFNAECFSDGFREVKVDTYIRKGFYKAEDATNVLWKQLVREEYFPCVPLSFYDRDFIVANNLHFYKGIIGEDELFSFHVYYRANRIGYCSEALYHRRIRPGSIMTSRQELKKFQSYYRIYCEMRDTSIEMKKKDKKVFNEYIVRIVKSTLLSYRSMTDEEKFVEKESYQLLKNDIYRNHGYGDFTLVIRTINWYLGILFSGLRKNVRKIIYG